MAKKKTVILGGGISGLSAAWHLQKSGIDCHLYEKEHDVGGLCRSKKVKGFTFDYCGHLLHFQDAYALQLVKKLLGDNLSEHHKSAWVYSFNRYSRYPFQVNLYGLPYLIMRECLMGFIDTHATSPHRRRRYETFYDWTMNTFGKGISKYFMIPYNTKFWTVSADELTCEWLDDFIPVPSLKEVIEGTIEESTREFGYNARFLYPTKGAIHKVPMALAQGIKNVHTGCEVSSIDLARKCLTFKSGEKVQYDCLISTLPLPELAFLVKSLRAEIVSCIEKLRWNSIFNVNLGIKRKDAYGRHWIYFPQKELSFFRVGFFHNFSYYLNPPNTSSLYVEVSYSKTKPIEKATIVSRVVEDLQQVGLLDVHDEICVEDVNDISYGYPIYDKNYSAARARIMDFLKANNVLGCGRYGSWRYMSIEHSLLDGKRVAESCMRP